MAIKIIVQFICKFRHANSQRSGKALFFRLNGDYLNLKIELKKSFLSLEARNNGGKCHAGRDELIAVFLNSSRFDQSSAIYTMAST